MEESHTISYPGMIKRGLCFFRINFLVDLPFQLEIAGGKGGDYHSTL
jgi:hypothetical protein